MSGAGSDLSGAEIRRQQIADARAGLDTDWRIQDCYAAEPIPYGSIARTWPCSNCNRVSLVLLDGPNRTVTCPHCTSGEPGNIIGYAMWVETDAAGEPHPAIPERHANP